MVALYIEDIRCALGIGEGGWIHEDKIELIIAITQPFHAVRLIEMMAVRRQPIKRKITLRPFDIGGRQIHRRRGCSSTQSCLHTGYAGIGKEIEEVFSLRLTRH